MYSQRLAVGRVRPYPSMRCLLEKCWMGLDGFVPSYNLQVAVSVLTVEALKQRIA